MHNSQLCNIEKDLAGRPGSQPAALLASALDYVANLTHSPITCSLRGHFQSTFAFLSVIMTLRGGGGGLGLDVSIDHKSRHAHGLQLQVRGTRQSLRYSKEGSNKSKQELIIYRGTGLFPRLFQGVQGHNLQRYWPQLSNVANLTHSPITCSLKLLSISCLVLRTSCSYAQSQSLQM